MGINANCIIFLIHNQFTYIGFKSCVVENQQTFLDHLVPLVEKVSTLEFIDHYGTTLPIRSIVTLCPQLKDLPVTLIHPSKKKIQQRKQQQQHQDHSFTANNNNDITRNGMHHPQGTIHNKIFNLTSLVLGIDSSNIEEQHRRFNTSFNCSGSDLAYLIHQSPQLRTVILSRTGDNIDPIVIQAITKLTCLYQLELHYNLTDVDNDYNNTETNEGGCLNNTNNKRFQEQGALYSLLAKHAASPCNTTLRVVSLNVADDTIMELISEIPLTDILLTDGFSMVSPSGLLKFVENLREYNTLNSFILRGFDLRPPPLLDHLAHLPTLFIVDITDCRVNKESYYEFLKQAPNIRVVVQPLHCFNKGIPVGNPMIRHKKNGNYHRPTKISAEVAEIACLRDLHGVSFPITLIHLDQMPTSKFNRNDKWNPYVVLTDEMHQYLYRCMSFSSSSTRGI